LVIPFTVVISFLASGLVRLSLQTTPNYFSAREGQPAFRLLDKRNTRAYLSETAL
jgi:hypothetical protein